MAGSEEDAYGIIGDVNGCPNNPELKCGKPRCEKLHGLHSGSGKPEK
jgi:hypothetical protein